MSELPATGQTNDDPGAILIALGRESGQVTAEQVAAAVEEVELGPDGVRELHTQLDRRRHRDRRRGGRGRRRRGRSRAGAADRRPGSDGRAGRRLVAPLPARDRAGAAADGRPGGRARQTDRARRHGCEASDGRGQPATGRLDRQGLRGPRPQLPRPDPGGVARADQGGREVRLQARLQVFDVRDVVDPAGRDAGGRRQEPHDPHPRPHQREADEGPERRAEPRPGPRARAGARRGRPRGRARPCRGQGADGVGRRAGIPGGADRRGRQRHASPTSFPTRTARAPSSGRPTRCSARASTAPCACSPTASGR